MLPNDQGENSHFALYFLGYEFPQELIQSGKLKKAPLANHDHTVILILFLKAISVIITNNNTENTYYDF